MKRDKCEKSYEIIYVKEFWKLKHYHKQSINNCYRSIAQCISGFFCFFLKPRGTDRKIK